MNTQNGYEKSDARFKSVVLSGVGLLGLMVAGIVLSLILYSIFKKETAQPGAHPDTFTTPNEATMPEQPRLESDPHASLLALRHREDSLLSSYGRSPEDSAFARVPITRAMKALAEEGLP